MIHEIGNSTNCISFVSTWVFFSFLFFASFPPKLCLNLILEIEICTSQMLVAGLYIRLE